MGADARASGSPNRTVAENDELVRELASALAQAFTHERVPNGASLLDVGCGNGDLLRALVRALGSAGALGAVHVLDVSGSAVALARRRLAAAMPVAAATARDISLPGDAFALPDAPFDVALLARVLEHVPVERRAAALRNALSVVARTGVVLLVAERGAVDGVADAAARAGGFDTPTVYELDAEAYSAAAAATHVVVALRPRADGA